MCDTVIFHILWHAFRYFFNRCLSFITTTPATATTPLPFIWPTSRWLIEPFILALLLWTFGLDASKFSLRQNWRDDNGMIWVGPSKMLGQVNSTRSITTQTFLPCVRGCILSLWCLLCTHKTDVILDFNGLVKFMDVIPNLGSHFPFLGVFYVPWYAISIRRNDDFVLSFIWIRWRVSISYNAKIGRAS